MILKELSGIHAMVIAMLPEEKKDERIEEVALVTIPVEWERLFTVADRALKPVETDVICDHIPENELTDRYHDLVEPHDSVFHTLIQGDDEVTDRLFASIKDGGAIQEAINALRGELASLFKL